MTNSDKIIGRAVATLIKRTFLQGGQEKPGLLIKNFSAHEVAEILPNLEGVRLPNRDSPLEVLVSAPNQQKEYLAGLQAPQKRLANDETLVKARNRLTNNGVVLIVVGTSSTESLNDFPMIGDDSLFENHQSILEHGWELSGDEPLPGILGDKVAKIFTSHLATRRPSLRRWVKFVDQTIENLRKTPGPWTDNLVSGAITNAFPTLHLFPDPEVFFSDPIKRLQSNLHISNKQNPVTGYHIEDPEWETRITGTQFIDKNGEPLDEDDISSTHNKMRSFILTSSKLDAEPFEGLDLQLWLQLFSNERKDVELLGVQASRYIADMAPERVPEFDELDLVDGLNNGSADSAEKLISAVTPNDQRSSLFGVLSHSLQRKIEKLIFTRGIASDPLIAMLRNTFQYTEDGEEIEIRPIGNPERSVFTRRLFSLLYGKTLQEVALQTADSAGIHLLVHADLLQIGPLFEILGDDDDDDDDDDDGENDQWSDLKLEIKLDGNTISKFTWSPKKEKIISFGRLIMERSRPNHFSIQDLNHFENEAVAGLPLPVEKEAPKDEFSTEWIKCSKAYFSRFQESGLDAESLISYAQDYEQTLNLAKSTLTVPQAATELANFLDLDTASMPKGNAVLATHPIRLRWLGEKLRHVRSDLVKMLCGELRLNALNENFYFDWLEDASPFQQPPVTAIANSYNFSIREIGLHQEHQPLVKGGGAGNQWTGGVDEECLKVIASQVDKYVKYFPHKVDGLTLLIIPPVNDSEFPANLIRKINEKTSSDIVLKIHVAADPKEHHKIASLLSQPAEKESERTEAHKAKSLMPLFQVAVHDISDFAPDAEKLIEDLKGQIDIAIVPDLFSANVDYQDNTQGINNASGNYSPLLDPPIHQQDPIKQSSVLELIPTHADPLLLDWQTLNVRRKRNAPVGEPEATDFVSVSVRYEETGDQFVQLHSYAHWVVTLDQFVGRSQIDAMNANLDVIHVDENIGTNKAYSLVVSSNSGKDFVQQRLASKLINSLGITSDTAEASEISKHLYEIGRDIAPTILLRALGLGQTAAEVIGLTVQRHQVFQEFPVKSAEAIEVYLNLDELTSWFGGHRLQRADLLRLLILPPSDGPGKIEMLVCESKYRDSDSSNTITEAAQQVEITIELLKESFCCEDGEDPPSDQSYWYRSLADAISQTPKKSSDALKRFPAYKEHSPLSKDERRQMIKDIAHGEYQVSLLEGAVISTVYATEGENTVVERNGLKVLHVRKSGLQKILKNLKNFSNSSLYQQSKSEGEVNESKHQVEIIETEPENSSKLASQPPRVGMTDAELSASYQRVLDAFSSHNVSVERPSDNTVPIFEQGPGFYIIRVKPATGTAAASLTRKIEELKLSLELEREQNIRYYLDRGSIVFEIPKQDHQRYFVDAEQDLWDSCTWPDGELYAPIGEDISGDVVGINFSSSTSPHLLIAGATGSGKSVALETILRGLCREHGVDELRLDLVDPKQTELISFAEDPHVNGEIGFDVEDAVQILEELLLEMESRYSDFREMKVNSLIKYNEKVPTEDRKPWRVLVLDEYADLTADRSDQQQIEAPLRRLAAKGRAAGIHIILATQRPSVDVINAVIRSNFPAQLALRVRTNTDSQIIIGESGAESLAGNGDALFRTADGIKRIQCAKYTP
jgi:DNA segregation ATPase FtsK/SpoIIIE, S-DNA-T family